MSAPACPPVARRTPRGTLRRTSRWTLRRTLCGPARHAELEGHPPPPGADPLTGVLARVGAARAPAAGSCRGAAFGLLDKHRSEVLQLVFEFKE
ncbi:hypothetical protein [Nonomuraea sp. NPDC049309]|uniref:hypothetical protein n=1 Tax=Nonomuraea sp. NPDC049309 TaxID=3364350 RepID=UPI00371712CC